MTKIDKKIKAAPPLPVQTMNCHSDDLRSALTFVRKVIRRRNAIPILGMVRLVAKDGKATISATDLDIECEQTIDAEGDIAVMLNPSILHGLIRMHHCQVSFAHDPKVETVTICAGPVTARLRVMCDVIDCPVFNTKADDIERNTELTEGDILRVIGNVDHCISTEETRYYLNGVYIHNVYGSLCAVATDGHKLALYKTKIDWSSMPNMILPSSLIPVLREKLRRDGNEPVQISAPTDVRITFKGQDWLIKSKTINGTFPDYTRVIPTKNDGNDITLTDEALKMLPVLDQHGSRAIKLDPEKGVMVVHSHEYGEVSMPLQGTGHHVGFKLGYLRLFSRRAGTIRIKGENTRAPHLILTEDPDLVQVLMPMRF